MATDSSFHTSLGSCHLDKNWLSYAQNMFQPFLCKIRVMGVIKWDTDTYRYLWPIWHPPWLWFYIKLVETYFDHNSVSSYSNDMTLDLFESWNLWLSFYLYYRRRYPPSNCGMPWSGRMALDIPWGSTCVLGAVETNGSWRLHLWQFKGSPPSSRKVPSPSSRRCRAMSDADMSTVWQR